MLARRDFQTTSAALRGNPKSSKASRHEWNSSNRLKRTSNFGSSHDRKSAGPSKRSHVSQKNWTPELVRSFLLRDMARWSKSEQLLNRLRVMGISLNGATRILDTFISEMPEQTGGWFPPSEDEKWQFDRVVDEFKEDTASAVDGLLTRRFIAWALETPERVDAVIYKTLDAVQKATDYRHPASWFARARQNRRKVIMHIGPTNSGKTHNALRALAAARNGIYASPLRLLAHEIFIRLNNGEIIPRGADINADKETFKRPCNLVTGEERRIMSELAGLTSCTVEMISADHRYDVAVIDEIQMLSDPERGGAWTSAVLGLNAEELHLCGEERALPLVQQLLEDTGDELIINRYDRLTPLQMAEQSLMGDFKAIKKGDCVVAFSREKLFALKRQIERETGMRCAIIYGRLPPEVRAEQAALFNDPDSGYDVLVGSDAIGMGLNLKIKRIVFESSQKYTGIEEVTLSRSQLKQIAGRAGRFGLHAEDTVGIVTTLHEKDLAVVEEAVTGTFPQDPERATFPHLSTHRHALEQLISPRTLSNVNDVQYNTASLPPYLSMNAREKNEQITQLIDTTCSDLTLEERMVLLMAPLSWRDPDIKEAGVAMLTTYKNEAYVSIEGSLGDLDFVEALEKVKILRQEEELLDAKQVKDWHAISTKKGSRRQTERMPTGNRGPFSELNITLRKLESLYRIAIVYMWLSMRLPVAFPEHTKASTIKKECEDSITWCLQKIRSQTQSKLGRRWSESSEVKGESKKFKVEAPKKTISRKEWLKKVLKEDPRNIRLTA